MGTERLYEDAYVKAFTAKVTGCEAEGDRFKVTLDKTAFFPEGGGQPADKGKLNGKEVLDVQEKGEEVFHYLREPLVVGETVEGALDWETRYSVMQQHSGEHLVSGIIHRRYGYNNIGFHMGHEMIEIDFDGVIPPEDIEAIENEANEAVWADKEAEILYPSAEELKELDYRSKKAIDGQIRLVRFEGTDLCACCGTHVRRAGEIGIIKFLYIAKAHGGTRIDLVIGRQALRYLRAISAQNTRVCQIVSAKPLETADAVQKLLDDKNAALAKVSQIERKRYETVAASMDGKEIGLLFEEELSGDGIRNFANAVLEHVTGVAAVFAGDDENGYKYVINSHDGDLREFAKSLNEKLNGRGGGKPLFVQGSVQGKRGEIEAVFQALAKEKLK